MAPKMARTGVEIKIAGNDEPLLVNEHVLRASSLVAAELPESASVWDISGLLIEGEPATRDTVVKWLNLAYKASHKEPYEEQPPSQRPWPDTTTAVELFKLLAFADSIASSQDVYFLLVAKEELRKLRLEIGGFPEGFEPLRLAVDGRPYVFDRDEQNSMCLSDLTGYCKPPASIPETSEEAIVDQIVEQVEKLLYISYKLQLKPLLQRLHMFIAAPAGRKGRAIIPRDKVNVMFSPRVLEASGFHNDESIKKAWITSQTQQHLNLINGPDALLRPSHANDAYEDPYPSQHNDDLECPMTLNRDWAGMAQGEKVKIQFDANFWPSQGRVWVQSYETSVCVEGMLSMKPSWL